MQISRGETVAGRAIQDRYSLYFDFKEGLRGEKFETFSEAEQEWIVSRFRLGNVTPHEFNLAGYGDKVIRQICDENRLLSELKRMTRESSWRQVFSPFLDELIWPFAASVRLIT
jgi:hypothetical protein